MAHWSPCRSYGKNEVTKIDTVTEIIERLGEGTVQSVFAAMQGYPDDDRLTLLEIASALHNAVNSKRIEFLRSDPRPTKHSRRPRVYGPVEHEIVIEPPQVRPVSSVFEMGDRARAEHFDRRSQALHRASI